MNLKFLDNLTWDKYAVRQFRFYYWSFIMDSYQYYRDHYGDRFDHLAVSYYPREKIYFRCREERERIEERVRNLVSSLDYVEKNLEMVEGRYKRNEEYFISLSDLNLRDFNDSEITDLFGKMLEIGRPFLAAASTNILVIEHMSRIIRERIIGPKLKESSDGIDDFMAKLTTTYWPIVYLQEETDLLRLVLARGTKDFEIMLDEHHKRYFFVWLYNKGTLLSKEDFVRRIDDIKYPERQLRELEEKQKKNAADVEKVFEDLGLTEEERRYVNVLRKYLYYRIHEEYLIGLQAYHFSRLFREISRRRYIAVSQLEFFTMSELRDLLNGKELDIDQINKRPAGALIIYENGKQTVFVGGEASEFLSKIYKEEDVSNFKGVLEGTSANKGLVTGRVKVIFHTNDLQKIHSQNILVASNTNPAYVPAMKIARAVVTDEGGVTCHAAIVSRELGIPCVIGTKIATKVLRDGDEVEVDATNGIIKKL